MALLSKSRLLQVLTTVLALGSARGDAYDEPPTKNQSAQQSLRGSFSSQAGAASPTSFAMGTFASDNNGICPGNGCVQSCLETDTPPFHQRGTSYPSEEEFECEANECKCLWEQTAEPLLPRLKTDPAVPCRCDP
mmetsp:Transcript_55705/g.99184  ORF Transcript_55705/g.99184 Transcript_55705/m.99184 type:complete len:135 (+) Transcript_55705:61-465(+)